MFIYVFNRDDMNELIKRGYVLLIEDQRNQVYVFERKETSVFDISDISFVYSDVLTL